MSLKQIAASVLFACPSLFADNLLHPGVPQLDRPTLTTLGVQLPLTGDDNFNASVAVQYRVTGTQVWHTGLPLFRVHPETVAGYTVAPQFGGSIFDLRPATSYDIQLHAVDPDGLDQTFNLTASTRPVPSDPINPRIRNVVDVASFQSALSSAQPGDIILLANGTYPGSYFGISQTGTAANPIVIRGASEDGVILDGGNCQGCNIFEFYGGGYVHLEQMTMQNATRAIRIQQPGTLGIVIRHVHIKNTDLGIGGRANQNDTYIADNILEGRISWPHVYSDDGGSLSSNTGISVFGFGDVVAHNRISGYGDAMRTEQDGARANDFYGNDVVYTYDNAIELDGSEGNTRFFRNRVMNTFSPLSVQPVHGGPAYLLRNVVVNIVAEQLKLHPLGGTPNQEPSGVLVYHNTFVSPPNIPELNLQTSGSSHYFEIENNLFVAPPYEGPEAADWTGLIDHGTFDYNGYFPDGIFRFNNPALGGYFLQRSFAGLQSLGVESHGLLATGNLFASGLTAPSTYTTQLPPADVTPASGAVFLDRGRVLPNINDNFQGAGPDFGAVEQGCPAATYGPRPIGIDESNEVVGCAAAPINTTAVSVAPSVITLGRLQSQQFTATTTPAGGSVLWTMSPARGTVSSSGLYTAPVDALAGETVIVFATSANSTASSSAQINLTSPVSVSLAPTSVTVAGSQTQQFSASVSGAVNTAYSWTLTPALGTITIGGLFTAPAATSAAQTITVTAVSAADPTKTASAVVTVPAATRTVTSMLQGMGLTLASASLSTEGTLDWMHSGESPANRKAGVTPILGQMTPINPAFGVYNIGGLPEAISWNNGAPNLSSTGNTNAAFLFGIQNGYTMTVPVSASNRVLRLHVGGWGCGGTLTATLSDGSVAPYVETVAFTGNFWSRDYVINFSDPAPGQTLRLSWVMSSGYGGVTWSGAALGTN